MIRTPSNMVERGAIRRVDNKNFAMFQPVKPGPYHLLCRRNNGDITKIFRKVMTINESPKLKELILIDASSDEQRIEVVVSIGISLGRGALEVHGDHLVQWESGQLVDGVWKAIVRCASGRYLLRLRWNDVIHFSGSFVCPGTESEPKQPPTIMMTFHYVLPEIVQEVQASDGHGNEVVCHEVGTGSFRLANPAHGLIVIQGADESGAVVNGLTYELLDFETFVKNPELIELRRREEEPEEPEGTEEHEEAEEPEDVEEREEAEERDDEAEDPVQFTKVCLLNFFFPPSTTAKEPRMECFKDLLVQLGLPQDYIGDVSWHRMFNGRYKVEFEVTMGSVDFWDLEDALAEQLRYQNLMEFGEDESRYMKLCQTDTVEDTLMLMGLKQFGVGRLSEMRVAHGAARFENEDELLLVELVEKFPEDIAKSIMRMPGRLQKKCQNYWGLTLPSPVISLASIGTSTSDN